jgi:DNA-binding transcriptional LysR family regulator
MLEQHLEKLRSFYAAAQSRSILQAANNLGVTQPAVSKNIKFLEDLLGVSLFVRRRHGVELSSQGHKLHNFCETMFLRVSDIEKKLLAPEEVAGVIRIGTYETLGESFWPRALSYLNIRFPHLIIELITNGGDKIWSQLEEGSLDFIVDAEPRTSDNFVSYVLYEDSFGLYFSKKFKANKDKSSFAMSFVRHAVDRQGQSIETHLKRFKVNFELRYNVESFTMARSLANEGLCISVLPRSLGIASKLLSFKHEGREFDFGQHRICVTTLESLRKESRSKAVVSALREVLNS